MFEEIRQVGLIEEESVFCDFFFLTSIMTIKVADPICNLVAASPAKIGLNWCLWSAMLLLAHDGLFADNWVDLLFDRHFEYGRKLTLLTVAAVLWGQEIRNESGDQDSRGFLEEKSSALSNITPRFFSRALPNLLWSRVLHNGWISAWQKNVSHQQWCR